MVESAANPGTLEITRLLLDWRAGDASALDRLMPAVYDELRRLAAFYMRRQDPGHTLQTSALVNEAYLRLVDSDKVNWQNRSHFYAIAAQLMRRVLVDAARRKNSRKRGGGMFQVTLNSNADIPMENETDMVALDTALEQLSKLSPRQGRVVELKFFGGLTEDQIADVMEVSTRTVRRDWNLARAWLFRELTRSG